MKKSTLIGMFFGFYLGATINGLFGAGITDLRWWIVVIPTVVIAEWRMRSFKEDN